MQIKFPKSIDMLIRQFSLLPGVGRKTAERYALEVATRWSQDHRKQLAQAIDDISSLKHCSECGLLSEQDICSVCSDPSRDTSFICCIASLKDLFAIEGSGRFNGIYHVVETLLSPIDGRGTEKLKLSELEKRLEKLHVKEALLAFDPSVEGEATARFLKHFFDKRAIRTTRLAFGIPLHSSLEYVDGGTLGVAIEGRSVF